MEILALATSEARRIRKFRDREEEADDRMDRGLPEVPLLHISRTGSDRWTVRSSGEAGHPNEARMPFIRDWIEREVLTALGGDKTDVSGTYRLQLHDSCSYLPRASEFRDVLSFGRVEDDQGSTIARIPDPFQVSGYGLGAVDDIPWHRKQSKVVFAGSTTGDTDPGKNARILACLWALGHPEETDFRISAVVQMRPFDVCTQVPCMADILAPHLPPEFQFRNRFIANIVGNTACWSRVPMVLGSGSVMFHMPHADTAWYYPAMVPGLHYVECVSHDEILRNRLACLADEAGCQRMTATAKAFKARYLTREAAVQFACRLLSDVKGR